VSSSGSAVLVAFALALGCAAPQAARVPERQAALATPEPDPACRTLVANAMALSGLERVTARVAIGGDRAAVDLLAPELTSAAADDVHRAFAQCTWSPGADGATSGTVVFTRP
jgi:hypothetical protein